MCLMVCIMILFTFIQPKIVFTDDYEDDPDGDDEEKLLN